MTDDSRRTALWGLCLMAFAGDSFGRENKLPANPNELTDRALAFEIPWNRFVRTLVGCPETGDTDAATCVQSKLIDYAAFFKARNAAKKLFDLREP